MLLTPLKLMDMCMSLQCSWPLSVDEALSGPDETNTMDLCDTARVLYFHQSLLSNRVLTYIVLCARPIQLVCRAILPGMTFSTFRDFV